MVKRCLCVGFRPDFAFACFRVCILRGQHHLKNSSPACARTTNSDGPTMQLHQLAHDRKSETKSAVIARGRRVGLAKAIEDIRQKFRFDSQSRVDDGNCDWRVDILQPDPYLTARWRKLDGVG